MSLDFSFRKYDEILSAIANSQYRVITIEEYILNSDLPDKYIIIRHDVDLDPYCQVKFAEFEYIYNMRSSYYFRFIDKIYKEDIIEKVSQFGHSVGYHYEVYTKAKGDPLKAIIIFRKELEHFKKNWACKTVCPHGGSFAVEADGYSLKNMVKLIPKILTGKKLFSAFTNFDIWDNHRFEEFGIIGDAYRSIDFTNFLYLSDTGRSWDKRFKRLDKVNSEINPKFDIITSDDIIRVIKNHETDKIYLLVHAEQWKDNFIDWLGWYAAQLIRRLGKKIIFGMK
jgi:hypothetical protein